MKPLLISAVLYWSALAQTPQSVDWVFQVGNKPAVDIRTFQFPPIAPGSVLNGGSGNQIVMMAFCPLGLNGTDSNHWLYISGGTGTAEAVLVNGGTCTSGLGAAGGTIQFAPANNHSGAWTVQSATSGLREAFVWAESQSKVPAVLIPSGTWPIYAPIYVQNNTDVLYGVGRTSSVLQVQSNFPLTASGVLVLDETNGNHDEAGAMFYDFAITFVQPNVTTLASMTQYPPAFYDLSGTRINMFRMQISNAWNGIVANLPYVTNGFSGGTLNDINMSAFNVGLIVQNNNDNLKITNWHAWVWGMTGNQSAAYNASTTTYGWQLTNASIVASNVFFYCPTAISGTSSALNVAGFNSDTFNGIQWVGGELVISGFFVNLDNFGPSATDPWALQASGNAYVSISGGAVLNGNSGTTPIQFTGTSPGTFLTLNGIIFNDPGVTPTTIQLNSTGAGSIVSITGCGFIRGYSTAYTSGVISAPGASGTISLAITGNTFYTNTGTGSLWINLPNDGPNAVATNAGFGWVATLPIHPTEGSYEDFGTQNRYNNWVENHTYYVTPNVSSGGAITVSSPLFNFSNTGGYTLKTFTQGSGMANACIDFIPTTTTTINNTGNFLTSLTSLVASVVYHACYFGGLWYFSQ